MENRTNHEPGLVDCGSHSIMAVRNKYYLSIPVKTGIQPFHHVIPAKAGIQGVGSNN
jgi:hypothetical protein